MHLDPDGDGLAGRPLTRQSSPCAGCDAMVVVLVLVVGITLRRENKARALLIWLASRIVLPDLLPQSNKCVPETVSISHCFNNCERVLAGQGLD